LSPDDSHLAVMAGKSFFQKLSVYNLPAGTERTYWAAGVGNSRADPITQNSVNGQVAVALAQLW
jgi:hypothetical protein